MVTNTLSRAVSWSTMLPKWTVCDDWAVRSLPRKVVLTSAITPLPESLITAMALLPGGVARAMIGSLACEFSV